MKRTPWHVAYKNLAKELDSFYLKHKNNAGKLFYSMCMKDKKKFQLLNPWAIKFDEDNDSQCLDPVHIFASFNYYNISKEIRREKLMFYFDVLDMDKSILENIDLDIFPFFPQPNLQKIISNRVLDSKNEIWSFFHATVNHNMSEISKFFDNNLIKWFGLSVPSLTTFMFWIDSDNYIPLDKNTYALLKNSNVLNKFPSTFTHYKTLLDKHVFLGSELFRNLAHYAIKNDLISSLPKAQQDDINKFLNQKNIMLVTQKYVNEVMEALRYYGGEASLDDIYTYIDEHYGFDTKNDVAQSSIRKAIYFNSSDADLYQGKHDLFYTVEVKGKGIWGLRDFIPIENNIELTEDDEGFPEGKQKLRTHLYRERNPKVIREAKQRFKKANGKLCCQACGFDFKKAYGDIGEDYIEGHHTIPVSDNEEEFLTMVEDIALLCANCHRMIHRKRPWLKMEQLQELLNN